MKRALLILASILMLAACAPTAKNGTRNASAPHGPPEEIVAARAKERWDLIVGLQYKSAYDYLTPGYRQTTTMEAYATQLLGTQVFWTGADVIDVACDEPERCIANVLIKFNIQSPVPNVDKMASEQNIRETWLKSGGGWYFLPRKN